MSDVETLRAAAARLRSLAQHAAPGPWRHTYEAPCGDAVEHAHVYSGEDWLVADCGASGDVIDNAPLVATMHPGVANALADWLDKEADGEDLMSAVDRVTIAVGGGLSVVHSTWPQALAVARAILQDGGPVTAVRCDARTRHVSERYVAHAISEVRAALVDITRGGSTDLAVADIRYELDALEDTAWAGSVVECGWTGQADPDSWTCPQCRTWHTTDEGRMNR